MDVFGLFTVPNYLLIILIFLLSVYLYGRRTFGVFKMMGVPGPEPVTFIGNMIDMSQAPHFVLNYWREKYGDTFGVHFGCYPQLVFHDPKVLEEIYVKNFSNFMNRPVMTLPNEYIDSMMIITKDDHWKFLRTTLSPLYSGRQLKGMLELLKKPTNNLISVLSKFSESGQDCDVQDIFSKYTLDSIAAIGFGVDLFSFEQPDHTLVKNALNVNNRYMEDIFSMLSVILPSCLTVLAKLNMFNFLIKREVVFAMFAKQLLKNRRENPQAYVSNAPCKDFLETMLNAQIAGNENLEGNKANEIPLENMSDWRLKRGITDKEIISQCVLFFLAGNETTASTLSFFIRCMAFHPDIQEKVYQEIQEVIGDETPTYDSIQQLKYLDMCLAESLRMYPLIAMTQRECKNECVIKGIQIPQGMSLLIPIRTLHYDEKYWPSPHTFDPQRFNEEGRAHQTPFTYAPFGHGPRMCIGIRLAKLQSKLAIIEVLKRFRVVVTEKTEDPTVFRTSEILSAKNGIWLKFVPR